MPLPTDPLFLNAAGEQFDGLGRRVQAFFEKRGLSISVTTLRGVVETHAEQALNNGDISVRQRKAIHGILGHSDQVCFANFAYFTSWSFNSYFLYAGY